MRDVYGVVTAIFVTGPVPRGVFLFVTGLFVTGLVLRGVQLFVTGVVRHGRRLKPSPSRHYLVRPHLSGLFALLCLTVEVNLTVVSAGLRLGPHVSSMGTQALRFD